MAEWEKEFEETALNRGRIFAATGRVTELKEEEGICTGAVLGRQRYEVSIRKKDGRIQSMKCPCPMARGGGNCAHMAAILYALEGEEQNPDGQQEKEKLSNQNNHEKEEPSNQMNLEQWLREKTGGTTEKKQEKPVRKRKTKKEREEEAKQKAEAERQAEAERKAEAERQARREARELRKAEKARKEEEKRRQAEEARRASEEKRKAEEARREEIRRQKAEEAKRRAEKRRREQEAGKQVDELRAEYALLSDGFAEEDAEDSDAIIGELERYSYFDGAKILQSVKMENEVVERAKKIISQGQLKLESIRSGYERSTGQMLGQADAVGSLKKKQFPVRILFSDRKVTYWHCSCPDCARNYYYEMHTDKTGCVYKAAMLLLLEDYLNSHNLGDATDQRGRMLIQLFQEKRANQVTADVSGEEESLKLVPRLTRRGGKLSLSFRVGTGRMFVVKKLDEFCANVKNSATEVYGSGTEINHSISNFTPESREWISFLGKMMLEEEAVEERLDEFRIYRRSGVGSSMNLYGWRLDELYQRMGDKGIEFEDKDGGGKKKQTIIPKEGNPKVAMNLSAVEKDGAVFEGIRVTGTFPELYYGTDTAYYVRDGGLFRTKPGFLERMEPLAQLSQGGCFSFQVGRNHIADFYYDVLPQLEDIVSVTEPDAEKIRGYLPPDVHFVCYLDAPESNITCRLHAKYGSREHSVLDLLRNRTAGELEPYRSANREEEALFLTMQWLPEINPQTEELHCGGDEEKMYQMVTKGVEKLMEIAEVRCTRRFQSFHVVKHVKASVGVAIKSGLLQLEISTEDVSQKELLDILQSYRARKKYYRMKNGAFVSLEEPSLEMLAQMMETMHLKPKEFVQGKMHLPLYRTLYLDKMLEEHEGIVENRDSHFREMVKDFKTVKDADFEEPKSLSGIMRKYQKTGYKWLRTLASWKFGGILADDMGLGKTLQMIAVLLAAKQEGQGGTSLVVTPASLVFNWGEEFSRFAPELNVSLITGTQEERRKKLEDAKEVDVLVTSYDLLKRDIHLYEDKSFQYQVIDEAQYIKNHTTAAAKAVKLIKSQIRFALTGTPIENRLSELWSIFDYLMPGFLYSYDSFRKEIEIPIVRNNDEEARKVLQKMTGPFILRRLKENVLKDLPDKLEENRYVRFGSAQQKLYDGQVVHMRETIARQSEEEFGKNKMQILAELTRLRQICCDPSLCFENYKGEAAKLEACLQLVQSAIDGGHRMLLFSQFTSMLEILQKRLDEAGIAYYTITGSVPKQKRLQLVKEFNEGEVPVFLISLKAGGVGLNLIGADVVIHYDPWWNLAIQNQATDRAHRIGQTRKVTVYKLIVKNTIEEKIQKLQETKKDLADQIIGGETTPLGSLTREELLEVLGYEANL